MLRLKRSIAALVLVPVFTLILIGQAFAAIGCTLNNPDQDIKRLFPQSTSYKTVYIQIDKKGGAAQHQRLEKLLGDKLDNIYETIDVPYTYYPVFQGSKQIGFVHGVNQKGKYGGMQVIIATDMQGKILKWYYQKLSSPEAAVFNSAKFNRQFIGLTLADFYKHDYFKTDAKYASQDKVGKIDDMTKNASDDFKYTVRGMRKNLILLDEFYLNRAHETYYEKSQKLLGKK